MLKKGAAKKVTIYVNEDTQYHGGQRIDRHVRRSGCEDRQ